MSVLIAKNWWSLVCRGAAAMALGCLTWAQRGIGTGELQLFFGFYAILDGLLALAGAARSAEEHERWASLWVEALTSIAAGLIAFGWPGMAGPSLFYVIAAWALVTGLLESLTARRLRDHLPGEWLLAASGAASLILGLLLILTPFTGRLPVAYWVGAYGIVFGGLLVGLGVRLRRWGEATDPSPVVSRSL